MNIANKDTISRTEGHQLAKEFALSGLKPKEFCSLKKIPYHILKYWCDSYKKHGFKDTKTAKFFPVKVAQPLPTSYEQNQPALKININNKLTIEISSNVDLATLTNIFKACQACG
jgi:hypothetical protein